MSSPFGNSMPMPRDFPRRLQWLCAAMAVALALAGCGGGEAESPTAAAPAQLDQVAALTLAQQSVNERMAALPRAVALAAVSPTTASATDDFENGMADWSNWGNAQVLAGVGTSGSKAMQVGTGAGGAGLSVPGITPGAAYRLTAQVRVSDPSESVFIGINMLSSSGGQVIGHSSPAVTNTGYATVTVDLVAPANSATAVVWIWKNAGSGYAYLDDVAFGPPANPPSSPPAPPGSNLVTNGGFESGMTGWVNWGNASTVAGQSNSGTSALSVGTAAGGAGQNISGIVPGTVYRLVAQAKASDPSETVFVGANLLNQGGTAVAQMALPVSSTTYSTVTFDIRAPSDAVSAVVYVWKNAGSGFGSVDDVVFGVAPGSAPPPPPPPPPPAPAPGSYGNLVVNGGFENGLANWVDWGNTVASTGQAGSGQYAAQVGTGDGGFGQTVGNVVVGTTYRASAQVKVSSPDELGYFGLKFMDAAGTVLGMQYVTFNSTRYLTVHVELAAPANATSALVYVWKNAGSGYAYADGVALAQAVRLVQLTVTTEQVNPVEPGRSYPAVGAIVRLAGGGSVIGWHAVPGTDPGTAGDMCYQVYDASGARVGNSACVVGARLGAAGPVLGARADGGFTIAWNEANSSLDPSGQRWQEYDATGHAQGAIQSGPWPIWVTGRLLAGGGYIRLIGSGGSGQNALVSFQLYGADGTPIGSPQPVGPGSSQYAGDIVGLPGGGFAILWSQDDGSSIAAMTRAFAADGTPLGDPVAVAPNTLGPVVCSRDGSTCPPYQNPWGIAPTVDGGYIVEWMDGTGQGSPGDTFARGFRADGSPAGAVVGRIGHAVVGPAAAGPNDTFVLAIADGNAVTAWHIVATPLR